MKVNAVSSSIEKSEGRIPTAWDQHDNKCRLNFRQLIRPSLITMAVCGCYTYDADFIREGRERPDGRPYRVWGILYRTTCLLICLAACAKAVAGYVTLPSNFMQLNAIVTIWILQCFVVFLIFCKINLAKYGGHRKAMDFWDAKIWLGMEELGIKFPAEKIKRRQSICVFAGVLLCISNAICLSLFSADVFSKGYDIFSSAPFSRSVTALVLFVCILTMITLIWALPVLHVIFISVLLTVTFEAFNEFLKTHVERNSLTMTCQFQKIRTLHLNLCKTVTLFDNDFGCFFAAKFVFGIGLACFVLYHILKSNLDTISTFIFLFWMLAPLVLLGTASVFAAFVNEAAHGALDSIYYICVKDISTEQLGQLNLFLSKLTGTQTGFTTLGLLTITKEFLLTIAGVFLTYFFLLYTL